MVVIETNSAEETFELGKKIGEKAQKGEQLDKIEPLK